MKKLIWILIIALWLVPIGYIGFSYLYTPQGDKYRTVENYVGVVRQYIDDKPINTRDLPTGSSDDQYVIIYADYLATEQEINRRLDKERNFLLILVQPLNLATGQSMDVSLEKAADFESKINEMSAETQKSIEDTVNRANQIDKTGFEVFDVVTATENIRRSLAPKQKKFQNHLGLAQYVKAILEFVKSRQGYYELSQDQKGLVFSTPEDQAYYEQLQEGLLQYTKAIQDEITQRRASERKSVNNTKMK